MKTYTLILASTQQVITALSCTDLPIKNDLIVYNENAYKVKSRVFKFDDTHSCSQIFVLVEIIV